MNVMQKNIYLTIFIIISPILILNSCKDDDEKESAPRVKRVIRLKSIPTVFIELEDGARYGMGENLYNRLTTVLKNSGHFIVLVDRENLDDPSEKQSDKRNLSGSEEEELSKYDPSDRLHFNFPPMAAAEFSADIEGLSFSHNSKALRTFNGFKKDFRTPWNSGELSSENEFKSRSHEFQSNWFGNTFDSIGDETDNTISGVNAGQEGEFSIVVADVHYRRDSFRSMAELNTRLKILSKRKIQEQTILAQGSGFLFALGVDLLGLSVNFGIVKNDALKKVFEQSVALIAEEIKIELAKIPFQTRIEFISTTDGIIINAGRREGIQAGDIFKHNYGKETTTLKVIEAFHIGSVVEVVDGSSEVLKEQALITWDENGTINEKRKEKVEKISSKSVKNIALKRLKKITLKELALNELSDNSKNFALLEGSSSDSGIDRSGSVETKETKKVYFDAPEFSYADGRDSSDLNKLKKTIVLFRLLERWRQYDQGVVMERNLQNKINIMQKAQEQWNLKEIETAESWRDFFPNLSGLGSGVKIAIIDSGVDYNHNNLFQSFVRSNVGWDFFGNDERPFDDNSHGTAIAGIIAAQGIGGEPVGIAPDAKLLSYRVFNPYGETSSAAIYAAFERAVADGAHIIVTAWDTQRKSKALEDGIRLAGKAGILVVAAAGDNGKNLEEEVHYPGEWGTYPHVITVAALNKEGNISQVFARHSNYSPSLVSLAAPGEALNVLAPRSNYLTRGGSDMAAAHVAGAAALILSLYPRLQGPELKYFLLKGATKAEHLRPYVLRGQKLNIAETLKKLSN